MQDLEYYEKPIFQEFLLTNARKEITNPDIFFKEFPLKSPSHVLDFGTGMGFFIPFLRSHLPKDTWIWACDYQEDLLDILLQKKIKQNIAKFNPFFVEKSDIPTLPLWVPTPDLIISSLCISTFPNPGKAMYGLIRCMKPGSPLYIIEWTKTDYKKGPDIRHKLSFEKLEFLSEEYNIDVVKHFRLSEYMYAVHVKSGKDFSFDALDSSKLVY